LSLNKKLLIISLLYFAEGLPFGIIEKTLPIYFRDHGMSLKYVGLLSILTLPYALKFIWAPAVDFLGKRRHWIGATQLFMALGLIAINFLSPSHPQLSLWICLGLFSFFAATQDIAIDAYSIEMLEQSEMGMANGFRMATYRAALVTSGGLFIWFSGKVGWTETYILAACIMAVCALISWNLPKVEVSRQLVSVKAIIRPLTDLLSRPHVIQVTLFILLYKIGDFALGPMASTFWYDRGLTLEEIGLITGTFGIVAGILGGLAGGVFMGRFGIFHGLWFLGLCQPLGNVTYWVVSAFPETGNYGVYAASVAESFCSGLGTAAFLAFLMSICRKDLSATQYALISALFSVARIIAGALSGYGASHFGYTDYFALTLVVSFPFFIFLPQAKVWLNMNFQPQEVTSE
jgi:PAT family beta-lactamase induction signal transducer AmpG